MVTILTLTKTIVKKNRNVYQLVGKHKANKSIANVSKSIFSDIESRKAVKNAIFMVKECIGKDFQADYQYIAYYLENQAF